MKTKITFRNCLVLFCFLLFIWDGQILKAQGVIISKSVTTPTGMLDLNVSGLSIGKGFLLPRLTTSQRNLIPAPATGLMIYNLSTNKIDFYNGTYWRTLNDAPTIYGISTAGTITQGGIAINIDGANPDTSAMLDVQSTSHGFLPPRTLPGSITTPAQGMLIYNTSTNQLNVYDGTAWQIPCEEGTTTTGAAPDPSHTSPGTSINTTGAAADQSAMLDVSSTNRGFVLPRIDGGNITNLVKPATGLIVYITNAWWTDSPSNRIQYFNGTTWRKIISAPPSTPGGAAVTVSPTASQIVWNWNAVDGASGYKYNTVNNFATATDNGTNLSFTQTGLSCNTVCTLYVWAYNGCGNSTPVTLNQTTDCCTAPSAPVATAATAVTSGSFLTHWNTTAGTLNYYLDVSTDPAFGSFVSGHNNLNVGNVLAYSVTGLSCVTTYYYRIRASNNCGISSNSNVITAGPTLNAAPAAPVALVATSTTATSFYANWTLTGGTYFLDVSTSNAFGSFVAGYNNLSVGAVNTYNVTGLTTGVYYYRVRAQNACGTSANSNVIGVALCTDLTVTHTAGTTAPVTKTVTYGVVGSNLSGAPLCWITRNLGADNQATAEDDITEASAGWYWQFGRSQGFKHDGTTLTPTPMVSPPVGNTTWTVANDPCAILLGAGWRLPTRTEWNNVKTNGAWTSSTDAFNSVLKLHMAGMVYYTTGPLDGRSAGSNMGYYWTGTPDSGSNTIFGLCIMVTSGSIYVANNNDFMMEKAYALPVRCVK
jgi:hypothetical protein